MQALTIGEPGKAPAWYMKLASAAVMVPSALAPSFTFMALPDVGPEALKTSWRFMASLTGRPLLRASTSATGST